MKRKLNFINLGEEISDTSELQRKIQEKIVELHENVRESKKDETVESIMVNGPLTKDKQENNIILMYS